MQVAVIVFAIVVAIVLGAYWAFVVRPEDAESDAVRRRLRGRRVPQRSPPQSSRSKNACRRWFRSRPCCRDREGWSIRSAA